MGEVGSDDVGGRACGPSLLTIANCAGVLQSEEDTGSYESGSLL